MFGEARTFTVLELASTRESSDSNPILDLSDHYYGCGDFIRTTNIIRHRLELEALCSVYLNALTDVLETPEHT